MPVPGIGTVQGHGLNRESMPDNKTSNKPSTTADMVLVARALHVREYSPPVFDDSVAFMLLPPFWKVVLSNRMLTWIMMYGLLGKQSRLMPEVYVRARWAEEIVEAAVERGVEQVVILGAGYDSLALRRRDLMARIRLWEIDQAATQREKFRRMDKQGLERPANARYVEANLETDRLETVLEAAGVDRERPAVFVWLGVTFYLTKEATRKTLTSISSHMAAGTELCLDYMADAEHIPDDWKELRDTCAAFVAKYGEPWVSAYDPAEVPAFLQGCGFSSVDNMQPHQIPPRYLHRHPSIVFPEIMGFARAVV